MKLILLAVLLVAPIANAQQAYRVTLLRAASGSLNQLIKESQQYRINRAQQVSIMRHSQGDHWDLMLLEPAGKTPLKYKDFGQIVDFQHDFLAESDINWNSLKSLGDKNELYHIEMFHAKHGKAEELLKQRAMENAYLVATQRKPNIIFKTTFGSDVDSFTIGYYANMLAFASMPDLPAGAYSKAAVDAGFKSRDDIGLYLRELIVSHHDTLATKVE
jgi:hypothetical protein